MSGLSAEIKANAERHSTLLRRVNELEYASSSLEKWDVYLKNVKERYDKSGQDIRKLVWATNKERKEFESMRDSVGRKFASKLVGKKDKFEGKKAKEEREYVEALEKETSEREHLKMLKGLIQDAETAIAELNEKARQHAESHSELDALYSRLFDGPTPEQPKDDELEGAFSQSKRDFSAVQMEHAAEARAFELLKQASERSRLLLQCVNEALDFGKYDMMTFGEGGIDAVKGASLNNARTHAVAVRTLLAQAHQSSPQVNKRCLEGADIAQGFLVGDVVLDNIITDMLVQKKIKESRQIALSTRTAVVEEEKKCLDRLTPITATLQQRKERFDKCRSELYSYRASLFNSDNRHAATLSSSEDNSRLLAPPELPPPRKSLVTMKDKGEDPAIIYENPLFSYDY